MKKKFGLVLFVILGLIAIACTSEEAISGPQFIFKTGPNNEVAAKVMGENVSYDELTSTERSEIFDLEMKIHEIKMNKLRAIVLKKIMAKDPKSKGLSNDEYLERFIAKGVSASSKEIDAFIKERKIPKEHLNETMKTRVKTFLEREKKKKAIDKWMGQKTAKNPIEVYFKKPARPVFDVKLGDAPTMGGSNAKVTVIEFSDFQCPFCAKGATVINDLKKKYGDKIQVAFKNFPLPFHNHARKAAEAGLCANEQNVKKFWKMHDKMFADQTKLDDKGLIASAKALGLETKKFEACLTSGKYSQKVTADMEEGKKVGVKSTPTFFINGKIINGAQDLAVFSEIIDEDLKK